MHTLTITNVADFAHLHLHSKVVNLICSNLSLEEFNFTLPASVGYLDISNNNLRHFDLNKYPQILSLKCNDNKLETLTLSNDISKVDCANNRLTTIVITRSLTFINCSKNLLEQINLTQAYQLVKIECENNKLRELRLPDNVKHVFCENNILENLYLSRDLNSLSCSNNRLQYIDFTRAHQLQKIDCEDNDLQELILPDSVENLLCSNNVLHNLQFGSKLSLVICNNNKLTTLNLSANNHLIECWLNDNQLSQLILPHSIQKLFCVNNYLTSVNLSTCTNLEILHVQNNKLSKLIGIKNCENLKDLNCHSNELSKITIYSTYLKRLLCHDNKLTSLVCNCLQLIYLSAYNNQLTKILLNTPSLQDINVYNNKLQSLDLHKNRNLKRVNCSFNKISSLLMHSSVLELYCNDNLIYELSEELVNLEIVNCSNCHFVNIDLTSFPRLRTFYCSSNQYLQSFTLDNKFIDKVLMDRVDEVDNTVFLPSDAHTLISLKLNNVKYIEDKVLQYYTKLKYLNINYGECSKIEWSYLPNLITLSCVDNKITNLDFANIPSKLEILNLTANQLSEITIDSRTLSHLSVNNNATLHTINVRSPRLQILRCINCNLHALYVDARLLNKLECFQNNLQTLDLSRTPNLKILYCNSNDLQNLDLTVVNLRELECDDNFSLVVDVSTQYDLERLSMKNLISQTAIDVSQNIKLKNLSVDACFLESLQLHNNRKLTKLTCSSNQLEELDVSNLTHLENLICSNNDLRTLDLRNNLNLQFLNCSHNQLIHLYIDEEDFLTSCIINDNLLTTLPLTLQQLEELEVINFADNAIILNEQQNFFFNFIEEGMQNFDNDNQNVHNHSVVATAQASFERIKRKYPYQPNALQMMNDSAQVEEKVKELINYFASVKEKHVILDVDFLTAFNYIFPLHNEDSIKFFNELYRNEDSDLCFTGQFNRLVQSVTSVVEEVSINFSSKDLANNMALAVKNEENTSDRYKYQLLLIRFAIYLPDITGEELESYLEFFEYPDEYSLLIDKLVDMSDYSREQLEEWINTYKETQDKDLLFRLLANERAIMLVEESIKEIKYQEKLYGLWKVYPFIAETTVRNLFDNYLHNHNLLFTKIIELYPNIDADNLQKWIMQL